MSKGACTECLHHGPNKGQGHSNPDCMFNSASGSTGASPATEQPRQPSICVENWTTLPFSSHHLWKAGVRGEPVGQCTKCGKEFRDWCEEMVVRFRGHHSIIGGLFYDNIQAIRTPEEIADRIVRVHAVKKLVNFGQLKDAIADAIKEASKYSAVEPRTPVSAVTPPEANKWPRMCTCGHNESFHHFDCSVGDCKCTSFIAVTPPEAKA